MTDSSGNIETIIAEYIATQAPISVEQATPQAAEIVELICEHFVLTPKLPDNLPVGVNWYATKRHFIDPDATPNSYSGATSYRALCGSFSVWDPTHDRLNSNITRRRDGKGIETLPLCKVCAKRAGVA
ncbi:hypothetical protein SEA_CHEESETOUCH_90 [Gordonia phage CheeseTouch]|nr:hypothetical protein SEA_BEARBQ_83 [Gordonia phage BearBQ]